jgi:hypothetical protein
VQGAAYLAARMKRDHPSYAADRRVYNPENAALFLQRIKFSIARPAGMLQTVRKITRSIVKGEAAL